MLMSPGARTFVGGFLLVLFVSVSAMAQSVGGSTVSGFVRDATGLALPGATVTATKTDTGAVRVAITASDGAYSIPGLPVGPYQVRVEMQGFTTYVQEGIVLQVGSNPQINVSLSVGSLTEAVTVTAAAVMVESRSTGIGQVIDQQRVTELPLNGRRATELILLSGMATPAPAADLNTNKNFPTTTISVAGGSATGITYLLDGGSHNDPFNSLNLPTPNPDALQEFKVETSALPARFGQHAAAAVNLVTKSGTNSFHGTAFDFIRHYAFNEKNYFALEKDSLKRQQFGGTIGGPIVQNTAFFFTSYQGRIERTKPATAQRFVPTAAMRAGDFSAFASPACNNNRQITLRAPFVNNRVDPSQFSPAAVKLLAYVPVTTDPCGLYQFAIPNDNDENQFVTKIDYRLNDAQSTFGRYLYAVYDNPAYYDGKNALTLSRIGQHNIVHSAALGHNWVFGSNKLNALRVSISRTFNDRVLKEYFSPTELGVNVHAPTKGFTNVNVTGNGFSIGTGGTNPGSFDSTSFQIANDFDMSTGTHDLAFGFNWIDISDVTLFLRSTNGENQFNGTLIGLPLADFMLGKSSNFSQNAGSRTDQLLHYFAVYAQDSWRVRRNLTVNFGLRWEPFLPQRNRADRVFRFDLDKFYAGTKSIVYPNAPAGVSFPGDAGFPGKGITSDSWLEFAPRVGVIWQPSDVMSIRTAWGMFYDQQHLFFNTAYQNMGQGVSFPNPAGGFDNPYLDYPGGNPFPKQSTLSRDSVFSQFASWATYPLHIKPTVLHQYNVSIQRQIDQWLFGATYLGTYTQHLWGGRQLNPIIYIPGASSTTNTNQRRLLYLQNPVEGIGIGSVEEMDDSGNANYNGLLLSVQRRMTSNLSVLSNWTWSRCMTDFTDTQFGNSPLDSDHPEYDRGYCVSERRHTVNLSGVVRTPQFAGVWGAIASDWQFSPIIRYTSGNRSTPTLGVDAALRGGTQRPLQVLDDPYGDGTADFYFNRAAFATPPVGEFSTLGVNTLVNPSSWVNDLAITRRFVVGGEKTLQVRWEMFNVLNVVNYNAPTSALNSTNFGKITSAGDPRIMQFAFKFEF